MPRYQFDKPARAALLDQLIAAGFPATTLVEMDDTRTWVTVAPEDYDRVAAVVAAHDPAAIDAAADQERTRYQQDIANIKAFMATANTSITHLALVAVVKSIVRVLYRVLTDLKDA